MATFVLVPGAGGNASYWDELMPELTQLGHDAVTVDLMQDDPQQGLREYAQTVVEAIGEREDVVLVGQSLGAFVVPMVAAQVPVRMIVLLCPMIPAPGETPGQWWGNVDSERDRLAAAEAGGYSADFDMETYFLHDIPAEVRRRMSERPQPREPAGTIFDRPCDFAHWPAVPIHVLAGAEDRFFPLTLQRRVAHERLGIDAEALPGGHLLALSHARELAERLDRLAHQQ